MPKLKDLAERRKLEDSTVGLVLAVTMEHMLAHVKRLPEIPGAKLLFGGNQ